MGKNIILNARQRQLVERHMTVVDWVLRDYITANEGVVGLAREDLRRLPTTEYPHPSAPTPGRWSATV